MRKLATIFVASLLCVSLAVTSGLAAEYTLKVFGNANMDEVLDEEDIEYVQGIIEGTNDETELSDANYDGQIDKEDIAQIELIIDGEEEQLTLIDMADRIVTIPRPVERVVVPSVAIMRMVIQCGGMNKLVGVSAYIDKYAENMVCVAAYPELKEFPFVGYEGQENYELMVSLKPDVIFTSSSYADETQETTCIPVISISIPSYYEAGSFEAYRLVGRIMGTEEMVEELISYADEKFDEITYVTSQMPDDEKPRVYFCHAHGAKDITRAVVKYDPLDMAGGVNVAEELWHGGGSTVVDISKEQVIKWNPDIIMLHGFGKTHESFSIESVLEDPDLQTVNAVKNRNIYYTKGWYISWDPATGVAETFYMAKIFHPDEFENLNVEEENNEILERFYGVDGLYTWILDNSDYVRWES
jgi:iron complex transport system substrate-binding protein